MEISTFELLVKPIAPRIPGNPGVTAVARRVVQGYFLTISNLDAKDLTFRIEFFISNPNPPDPDRTLANNADLIFDIAGANTPITLNQSGNLFSGSFRLPAGQTASVQLLPKPTLFANPEPDFEVRGYVVLRLPAVRSNISPFITVSQSSAPVRVLLNPEIRGTFLPNDFPTLTTGDFDQINYSLALASGQALNELPPEPGRRIRIDLPGVVDSLQTGIFEPRFLEADALTQSQSLVELMAQMETTPENLGSLNDLLSKLDIPLQVSPVA